MQSTSATVEPGRQRRVARSRRRVAGVLAGLALLATGGALAADDAAAGSVKPGAKNVIVMISDGMGYNQMLAGDYYQYGRTGSQAYQAFPVRTGMSTWSVSAGGYDPLAAWGLWSWVKNKPTDSAAAATAMSTGVKTYDAGIGVGPDRLPLKHAAQYAEEVGKSTGVITSVQWSHATPAGFVAHNVSRSDYAGIAGEMIGASATDVIMGAGNPLFTDSGAPVATPAEKGYQYVGGPATWAGLVGGTAGGDADGDGDADPWKLIQTRSEFEALVGAKRTPARVCGTAQVATTLQQARAGDGKADPYVVAENSGVPDLATMTRGALNVLDANRKGFFLMVEGGAVDWASHANQPGRTIEEQIDFNEAVEAVMRWVNANSNWGDTLVIVTGDHETGYLWGPGSGADVAGNGTWRPLVNNGRGALPGMQFGSGDHTNSLIPLFAKGARANDLHAAASMTDPMRGRYLDNTAIAKVVISAMR